VVCDCDDGAAFAVAKYAKYNNDATIDGSASVNINGGRIRVAKNVFMTDGTFLAGEYVEVGNGSSVFRVYGNSIRILDAEVRDGQFPIDTPLETPFCIAPSFTCGSQNVLVGTGETSGPLAPGIYGRLSILNGGTLTLAPGDFTFCDIKMGRDARLEAQGMVVMQITNNLRVGTGSFFGPTPAMGYPPIGAYVLGHLVRTSQGATVVAAIVAPNAKMTFGRDADFNGCFCASQAKSDKHISLTCVE